MRTGYDPPLAILASLFMPLNLRGKNVGTKNGCHGVWEPPALTPAKNACRVPVPQIAATLLDSKFTSAIPPAWAWLRQQRARIQELQRPPPKPPALRTSVATQTPIKCALRCVWCCSSPCRCDPSAQTHLQLLSQATLHRLQIGIGQSAAAKSCCFEFGSPFPPFHKTQYHKRGGHNRHSPTITVKSPAPHYHVEIAGATTSGGTSTEDDDLQEP